jgi:LmbE family N-acetylglucosaminyl deacetylase
VIARLLVVAAHPDDDILGCGATMARVASEGGIVRALFLADGVGSRDAQPQDVAGRRADAERALAIVGATSAGFADLPDNALDTVPLVDLCRIVSDAVAAFEPDTVIGPSLADLNVDHRLAADAMLVACRPQPGTSVRSVLHYEVVSATGWRPTAQPFDPRAFVDVTDHVEAKLDALRAYGTELRPWPHARSLEAVEAQLRSRGAHVGLAAAEAFEVARWTIDITGTSR